MAWVAMCDCGWRRRTSTSELAGWLLLLCHAVERQGDPTHLTVDTWPADVQPSDLS